MIISEKQIMQLIMLARAYMDKLREDGMCGEMNAQQVWQIIEPIIEQQPTELKEVE